MDSGEKLRSHLHLRRDQSLTEIWTFLQIAYEKLASSAQELDMLLDRREADGLTPIPGSIPVPKVPAEAYPSVFGDRGFDDLGETAEATPIDVETHIGENPMLAAEKALAEGLPELLPEATQPIAKNPFEIEKLDESRAKRNGTSREDETTKVVHLRENGGRERRSTQRGMAPPPPVTEEAIGDSDDGDDEIVGEKTGFHKLGDFLD